MSEVRAGVRAERPRSPRAAGEQGRKAVTLHVGTPVLICPAVTLVDSVLRHDLARTPPQTFLAYVSGVQHPARPRDSGRELPPAPLTLTSMPELVLRQREVRHGRGEAPWRVTRQGASVGLSHGGGRRRSVQEAGVGRAGSSRSSARYSAFTSRARFCTCAAVLAWGTDRRRTDSRRTAAVNGRSSLSAGNSS